MLGADDVDPERGGRVGRFIRNLTYLHKWLLLGLGSVAHAPLAILIMVAEMTGSFSVVPGAIIAIGIASLLMHHTKVSIYRSQRLDRDVAQAERLQAAAAQS